MKAIWKVIYSDEQHWYATKKEATAFCEGLNIPSDSVIRVEIEPYLNPDQLVRFIRHNFGTALVE